MPRKKDVAEGKTEIRPWVSFCLGGFFFWEFLGKNSRLGR